MTKKILVLIVMLIVGWGLGSFYTPKTFKPKDDGIVSHCQRISKYDFYEYEEAVLKKGNVNKLNSIIKECSVDKLPYIIIMYDVYKHDVCEQLNLFYRLIKEDCYGRDARVDVPLRNFVKSVLTEYAERGSEEGEKALKSFTENE